MEIQVNETEYCKLDVHFEADTSFVDNKRDEIIDKFKKVKVPGFRPGKATKEAIKIHLKKQINDELKQEMASEAYYNTLAEKNIKPIGMPQFNNVNLDGSKFSCDFTLLKRPDFELSQYKDLEIPKYYSPITLDDYVQKMLEQLRNKYGEKTVYQENDFVQQGDEIIINYNAREKESGVQIEELTISNEFLTVGKSTVQGFDENLFGMKVGETREFVIKTGENAKIHPNKELLFSVELVNGSKLTPVPLNDELAKKIGMEKYEDLLKSVSSVSYNRMTDIEKEYTNNQIAGKLVSNHDFKVPTWISAYDAKTNARKNNVNWDEISDEVKQQYIKQAEDSFKLSVILEKIRDVEPEAQLSDEEVITHLANELSKYNEKETVDKIIQNLAQNNQINLVMMRIRDEYTLEFILKHSKIIE